MTPGLPEVIPASEGEKRQAVRRALSGIRDYRIRDVLEHALLHCADATVRAQNGKREVSHSKAETPSPGRLQQLRGFLARLQAQQQQSLQSILLSHPWGPAIQDILEGLEVPPPTPQEGPTQEELRSRFVRSLKRQRFPLPLQRAIEALVPDCTLAPAREHNTSCSFHGHYSLEAAQEASRQLQKISNMQEILNLSRKGFPLTIINQLLVLYIGDIRHVLRTEDFARHDTLQRNLIFTIDTVSDLPEEKPQRTPEILIEKTPEEASHPPPPTEAIPIPQRKERQPKQPRKRKEKGAPTTALPVEQPRVTAIPGLFLHSTEPARVPESQPEVSPELQMAAAQWSAIVAFLHRKTFWTLRETDDILAAGGTELTDKGNHWNVEGPRGRGTLPSAGVKDRALLNSTVQTLLRKTADIPRTYEWVMQQAG